MLLQYFGQPLFAVAARTTELARKAVLKAKIKYKESKPIVTIEDALKKDNLLFDVKKIKRGNALKAISHYNYPCVKL